MTFRTEFPDFPEADFPALPEGFVDSSWKNDATPSMWMESVDLRIFIEYADPAKREFPENEYRYFVLLGEAEALTTNDWAEVLAYIATVRAP